MSIARPSHPSASELCTHALRLVHRCGSVAELEAALVQATLRTPVRFGDGELRERTARGIAQWAWARRASVVPMAEAAGAQRRRRLSARTAWEREWSGFRREFLAARVGEPAVVPDADGAGIRWHCPRCGAHGSTVRREALALTHGWRHTESHLTVAEKAQLSDLMIRRMPVQLLTPYQRHRRDILDGPRGSSPHVLGGV